MENIKNAPRDTFLYLLSIITLIASAISFGSLAFGLTDIRFPDALQPYLAVNYPGLRMALATFIIVFPVYIWTAWFLRKDVVANPAKKEARIRRWLMWLTVFVSGLVVIGDLVTLLYNFLQGDLTASFIVKVIIVLVLAGVILFYYLAELRDMSYRRRLLTWIVIITAALAVAHGFYKVGSPQSQRLARFDQQKVSDLDQIQNQLVYYWQQKGSLPAKLTDLNDPLSSFSVPTDPQSGGQYEYSQTGAKAFQLCAVFNQAADPANSPIAAPARLPDSSFSNWQHPAGRACFDRTIDPSLYPVKPK